MVKDFSKSRGGSKNRPRKQPFGFFAVALLAVSVCCYVAGVLSGWVFFRPKHQTGTAKQVTSTAPSGSTSDALSQTQPLPPATGADTPLTFYKTLPHGAKAVIGSGLNQKKEEISAAGSPVLVNTPLASATPVPPKAVHPSAPVLPPVPHVAEPAPVPKAVTKVAEKEPQTKSVAKGGTYTVQYASAKEKGEADAIRVKLQARGLGAYVVESRMSDNSIRYRVRIGKNLSLEEAKDLAGAAGKGALPMPE